ncbi:MAG: amidohydrolase family protein [Gammaproteobacteria bacterium]|nr:amidohydrolase family protein [Gammaproteobacteria bacterium]
MSGKIGPLLFAALGVLGLAGIAHAQDVLIRNAKVYTQSGSGTLERADVLVQNGRVAQVGSGIAATPSADVIDARGRPLTPGLFGGITALGVEEISLEPSTVDSSTAYGEGKGGPSFEPRPEFDVTLAFNPDSAAIGVNRVEGITFAMVAPTALPDGTMFAGQGAIARLDGRVEAFAPASRTLFVDLGANATASSGKSRAAQYMLLEQATRESQPAKPLAAGDLRLLTPAGREVLARYLGGGRIAFSVDRAADIRQVLAYAERNKVHPVIVGGAQAWQVAPLLAKARVPVVLDPLVDLPGTFDQLGATLENAARLDRAGVPIAFTQFTDPTHNAHKVRQAAGVAVAHGLPWDAALRALTLTPAEVFGLGAELGRIAPGYSADLVLWSGDPLDVTSVAEQVWIGGRPQSMRSRQTELRDRYRPNVAAPTRN